MSRSVYLILSCLISSILLVAVAEDTLGVPSSSQQSVSLPENPVDASVEGKAGGDSFNKVTSTPVKLGEGKPLLDPRPRLNNRLLLTGTLVVGLLGQLSVLFGYLKINHATRGFYSGRLQSFSGATSVAVVVAGYFFYMTWKI